MRPHLVALGAIVVVVAAAAFGLRSAVALDLLFTLLYAVLGQSWNWISGYAGQISFGHAIFFGCGAYASALCVTHGLSPWLAIPAGALVAALLAIVTGFPTPELRGHYFSIATIAVAALVDASVRTTPWLGKATGFELPITPGWATMQFPQKGTYVAGAGLVRGGAAGHDGAGALASGLLARVAREPRRRSLGRDRRTARQARRVRVVGDDGRDRRGAVRAVHALRRPAPRRSRWRSRSTSR